MLKDVLDSLSERDLMGLQENWVAVAAGVHAGITIDEARGLGLPEFEGWDTSSAEQIFKLPDVDKQVLVWGDRGLSKKPLCYHNRCEVTR